MSWRLRIVHKTGFAYNTPVYSSYNEVRVTPRGDSRQTLIVNRVQTTPMTRIYHYSDYWSTAVDTFDLHAPHIKLEVIGTSVVETQVTKEPSRTLHWDNFDDEEFIDQYCEFLDFTEYVPRDETLAKIAQELKQDNSPLEVVHAVGGWVHNHLQYVRGTTAVHTNAVYAYQEGKGVCQDYAHLTLLLLRSIGIPARYVSGYFHPQKEPNIDETVAGESHAWIEAFIGEWWGFDPTNHTDITRQHVAVGTGRDYADVPPLKGIISGGGASDLEVVVEMTRIA